MEELVRIKAQEPEEADRWVDSTSPSGDDAEVPADLWIHLFSPLLEKLLQDPIVIDALKLPRMIKGIAPLAFTVFLQ